MDNYDISFDEKEIESEFNKTNNAPQFISQTKQISNLKKTDKNSVSRESVLKELGQHKILYFLWLPTYWIPTQINKELLNYDSAYLILALTCSFSIFLYTIIAFFCEKTVYNELFFKIGGKEIGYKQTRLKKLFNKITDYLKKNFATLVIFFICLVLLSTGTQDLIKIIR